MTNMDDFFNAEDELREEFDFKIHIHKQLRGRKCMSIIQGLSFNSKEESKTFLSTITKKFGIGGCLKKLDNIDESNEVFVFTGDCREKLKELLVSDYSKTSDNIILHG